MSEEQTKGHCRKGRKEGGGWAHSPRGFRSQPEARGLGGPPEGLWWHSDGLWSVSEDGSLV